MKSITFTSEPTLDEELALVYNGKQVVGRVIHIDKNTIVIDLNLGLANESVTFKYKVV